MNEIQSKGDREMSEFTPGPWEAVHELDEDDFHWWWIQDIKDPKTTVAKCFNPVNANLISAAPDMYEALEMVISYLGLPEEFQEGEEILYWKVTNSLKKAKGEPHE